jgi:hypothetical protein
MDVADDEHKLSKIAHARHLTSSEAIVYFTTSRKMLATTFNQTLTVLR